MSHIPAAAMTRASASESGRMVRVLPGDFHASAEPGLTIVTILGSCVAACIRNPKSGFGGLNHFMLPESDTEEWNGVGAAFRYGNFAMEALINEVLKSGCLRHELEVKLFGGASMYESATPVGRKNAAFAKHYLETERIPLAVADLGGDHGRRIHYCPSTGKVQRLVLRDREGTALISDEARYKIKLQNTSFGGDVDLFD